MASRTARPTRHATLLWGQVGEAGRQRAEARGVMALSGEGERTQRFAVKGSLGRQDERTTGARAHQLDGRLHRLGARAGKEAARQLARSAAAQLVGQGARV